jgi:hypothetical protein
VRLGRIQILSPRPAFACSKAKSESCRAEACGEGGHNYLCIIKATAWQASLRSQRSGERGLPRRSPKGEAGLIQIRSHRLLHFFGRKPEPPCQRLPSPQDLLSVSRKSLPSLAPSLTSQKAAKGNGRTSGSRLDPSHVWHAPLCGPIPEATQYSPTPQEAIEGVQHAGTWEFLVGYLDLLTKSFKVEKVKVDSYELRLLL